MQHLHTDYERELVPLFFKVLVDLRFLRSKLDEDAVDRVTVITHKLIPQSPEKRSLFLVKCLMNIRPVMEVVALYHSDTSMTATVNSFNWVGTHEYRNIAANCHF